MSTRTGAIRRLEPSVGFAYGDRCRCPKVHHGVGASSATFVPIARFSLFPARRRSRRRLDHPKALSVLSEDPLAPLRRRRHRGRSSRLRRRGRSHGPPPLAATGRQYAHPHRSTFASHRIGKTPPLSACSAQRVRLWRGRRRDGHAADGTGIAGESEGRSP